MTKVQGRVTTQTQGDPCVSGPSADAALQHNIHKHRDLAKDWTGQDEGELYGYKRNTHMRIPAFSYPMSLSASLCGVWGQTRDRDRRDRHKTQEKVDEGEGGGRRGGDPTSVSGLASMPCHAMPSPPRPEILRHSLRDHGSRYCSAVLFSFFTVSTEYRERDDDDAGDGHELAGPARGGGGSAPRVVHPSPPSSSSSDSNTSTTIT